MRKFLERFPIEYVHTKKQKITFMVGYVGLSEVLCTPIIRSGGLSDEGYRNRMASEAGCISICI